MVVMGIVAIIAGLSALKLPETVGNKLPETMDEAINIGKDSKRGICTCVCPKSLYEMFKEDWKILSNVYSLKDVWLQNLELKSNFPQALVFDSSMENICIKNKILIHAAHSF